ncbi:MAG: hypothetical protein NT062_31975, partial [Proteobacteria bacterium]|nr:hypothetical protein [Pseudomonadota bacterium]
MRASLIAIVAVLQGGLRADAAPSADLVVVWAPNRSIAPIEAVARELGLGTIDRSPTPAAPPPAIAAILRRGIDAYDALRFPEAATLLDQARDL